MPCSLERRVHYIHRGAVAIRLKEGRKSLEARAGQQEAVLDAGRSRVSGKRRGGVVRGERGVVRLGYDMSCSQESENAACGLFVSRVIMIKGTWIRRTDKDAIGSTPVSNGIDRQWFLAFGYESEQPQVHCDLEDRWQLGMLVTVCQQFGRR